jgi:hypothetical protein
MGRPPKVGGLRSMATRQEDGESTALPTKRKTFAFRSRASSLWLSLRRRRLVHGPDGEIQEEIARSKMDNPLDQVRFEDNNFQTDDPEIAQLIQSKEGYGLGLQFWSLDDERSAQQLAEERELRARLAARPDLAERLLKPSDADDFVLPQA